MRQGLRRPGIFTTLSSYILLAGMLWLAPHAFGVTSIPKWGVFEKSFRSKIRPSRPPHEARLLVHFISPAGTTNTVDGFRDGLSKWTARFSPDTAGTWAYQTEFTDPEDEGLHGKQGEFLCMAPVHTNPFSTHGPVRRARGGWHLEHADTTPFFWLADTAAAAARLAEPRPWTRYVAIRSSQNYSVIQWAIDRNEDYRGALPFEGEDPIRINQGYFNRMEEKIRHLNQAGMLAVIAPLWESGLADPDSLPEEQAVYLLRYAVARWGAYNVGWILGFEADTEGRKTARCKRIGRAVFGQQRRGPVVVFPGETYWAVDSFREEPWVDAFGYQSGDDVGEEATLWLVSGPITTDWRKGSSKPWINLLPPQENGLGADGTRITSAESQSATVRSLFATPVAGVSYSATGVADWNDTLDRSTYDLPGGAVREWEKALFLAFGKYAGELRRLFESIEFKRLRPAPDVLAAQPGSESPLRHVSVLASRNRDLVLVYAPAGQSVEVRASQLPHPARVRVLNLKSWKTSAAAPTTTGLTWTFAPPEEGDWILTFEAE